MRFGLQLIAFSLLAVTASAQPQQATPVMPDLVQELGRAGPGTWIRIVIRMKEQLSPAERRQILLPAKSKDSRRALAKRLRAFADDRQKGVRADLNRLRAQDLARNIRPLWISNVVAAEVKQEAVEALARRDDIETIKQDIERPVLQAPAWGVVQIHADQVWALTPTPYNGKGVVVGVLDSGIDLDHGDLARRIWINPGEDNGDGVFTAADNDGVDNDRNGKVDDVAGWDFRNGDNDPRDPIGHGTHVAGTVAGDGTGGTATGVAPGARLMALRFSDETAGQAEAWDGMGYALENGADIVNFSSGWYDDWSPDYVTWRQNTDTLTDAGVLFVVAAGNWGPVPPGGVLMPARAPRALAVGATMDTDDIGAYSGIGPSSWQEVAGYDDYLYPPGLLKPDVTAPGDDIPSTWPGGEYALDYGTSMAAPHVAGLAALLLEKTPSLQPHELAYLIRETAVDLGAAGPDNVFGHGRVNAATAVRLAYAGSGDYDLAVNATNEVWTTSDIWVDNNDDGTPDDPVRNQINHLYARIRNLGPRAAGNVEVKFYFADVGTIGIGGFDPDNNGDPADGNFTYITSYHVPLLGPAGSSQDEVVMVVPWNVPAPTGDHWCVGIGIVAPNPPNAPERVLANNRAFRNFFNILLAPGGMQSFAFDVWPDPRRPREPFDLVLDPRNLPPGLTVELQLDERVAADWLRNAKGIEPIKPEPVKQTLRRNPKFRPPPPRRAACVDPKGGRLVHITVPDGKPVRVQLVLRAPDKKPRATKKPAQLVIDTVAGNQRVGGLTLNMKVQQPPPAKPKLKR